MSNPKHPNDPKNPQEKWAKFDEKQKEEEDNTLGFEIEDTAEQNSEASVTDFPTGENVDDQLAAVEKKADEYKEKMYLAHAELDNVRKRAQRDVQNAHRYGNEKILTDLLPVMDSLTRALEGPAPEDGQARAMHEGMVLTFDMLEKTLVKFGVEVINPEKGDAFNPEQHEAMSMVPVPDAASNTVVQVLQSGYLLNGRVLRAAMVMVAQ
jgi:molecular chaperone GrpE